MALRSPSIEFQLLCLAIRLDNPQEAQVAARNLLASGAIDWQVLWELASWHRIRPQLAALLAACPGEWVPDQFTERINALRKKNAARQMANAQMFLRLTRATGSLPLVPFKGFWMAHRYYPRLDERESEDLDLFIYPEDLGTIKATFIREGLQPMAGYPSWDDLRILETFGEYNFDQFQGGVRTYHVECHGTLGSRIQRLDIRLADLEDQIREDRFSGQPVQVFSPSALLLLTALHHGGKDAWEELRQVLDIGLFLQHDASQLDWYWIQAMVERYDARDVFDPGMALAARLTGVALAGQPARQAVITRVGRLADKRMALLGKPPGYWNSFRVYGQRWLYHWHTKPGLKKKLRWARDYFEEAVFRPGAGHPDDSSGSWLTRWMGFFRHVIRRIFRIVRMELQQHLR